jgi:hypothetical protein
LAYPRSEGELDVFVSLGVSSTVRITIWSSKELPYPVSPTFRIKLIRLPPIPIYRMLTNCDS